MADATVPLDAADVATSPPVDAPMPTKPTISAHEQRELDRAIGRLSGEHREEWGPGMKWLIDHPDLSRSRVAEIVADDSGGRFIMEVKRAATVLGEIGHPDDVPVLATALARGQEVLSWDFAYALAIHRDPAALAALVDAAKSDNERVAQAVAGALGQRKGDDAARAALEGLLDHDSSHVRYTTVLSIIELGAKPSRAALAKRKKIEKDAEVRGALRKAGV